MQATVKLLLTDREEIVTFTGEDVADCHGKVVRCLQQGVLTGAFATKLKSGASVQAALDSAYAILGGETKAYTLTFEDGTEEHGIADCSPHALGALYYETVKKDSNAVERFRYHVQGECPNQDDCPVVNLALTLGIEHHFRAADSGS